MSEQEHEGAFLWPVHETPEREISQIGVSACGATAVLNILSALHWKSLPTPDEANKAVGTRLRKEDAPVTEYLLSRSVAGATHDDIINGVSLLTKGAIVAHFYPMYPRPPSDLYQWLAQWLRRGAVPLAHLNLQKGADGCTVPDAWHHQMIYGATPLGVYTVNPSKLISYKVILEQLCSESTIMIRTVDIVKRWTPADNFNPLMTGRWKDLKVYDNIVKLMSNESHDSHVTIPAAYESGITVFSLKDDNVQY